MTKDDLSVWLLAGGIFLLLIMSAFFSGSETALTATSRARMHKLESDGNKRAATVNRLIRDRERLIGAVLLGNNIANIAASTLATFILLNFFGKAGVAWATLVMTALIVVFSEIAPKTAAIARPDSIAMFVAPAMRVVVFLLAPMTRILQIIVRGALNLVGVNVTGNAPILSASEELRGAIDLHHVEGRVDKEARDLIRGALDLDEIRLEEIMVHRKSIEMIDLEKPASEGIGAALESRHTRLPLHRGDPDNIVGVLHAKDLLRALWDCAGDYDSIDLAAIARPPYFAPETTTLQEQLDNFKLKHEHFALVVDEYGAIMGLVTLEDILEEIVGEIEDEHDAPLQGVRPQTDGSVNVDGTVSIRDLNRALDWSLPDEEAVTVAGLVIHEAQSIPDVGQTFSFHGMRFRILRRRRNQITAINIAPTEPTRAAPEYKDI
ncbi:MAG TPA: HlyC/CorC family transporter [Parvularculaceae bacterium]|nr:HlyC/CorC family transporter [Parvularculaceae bacterium]